VQSALIAVVDMSVCPSAACQGCY